MYNNKNQALVANILGLDLDLQQINQAWSHVLFSAILFFPNLYSLLIP